MKITPSRAATSSSILTTPGSEEPEELEPDGGAELGELEDVGPWSSWEPEGEDEADAPALASSRGEATVPQALTELRGALLVESSSETDSAEKPCTRASSIVRHVQQSLRSAGAKKTIPHLEQVSWTYPRSSIAFRARSSWSSSAIFGCGQPGEFSTSDKA